MKPQNQNQHKIPQVYLKKFGYQRNGQWLLSVIRQGETFTRQKSVKSFTIATNLFDIDCDDPRIPRMFEGLNCDLENEYNNIVKDLEANKKLSEKSYAFLIQIIANLIVRSDYWRDWVLRILNHENKERFLRAILGHHCKDKEDFSKIHKKPFYRILVDSPADEVINRVLIYFIDHFLIRLWYYEIVIVESQEGKPWYTSTNPVVVHNRMGPFNIFNRESEIYFPITPKHMAYLHHKDSDDKENPLRNYETNKVYIASDDQNENIQNIIISNPCEYRLIAGHFDNRAK